MADTSADQTWSQLVELPEDERQAPMQERYKELAALSDDDRATRLLAMAQAEYALPDGQLRTFTISRLRALMSLDEDEARTISTSYDAVMRRMPGGVAMRRVSLIQTLARDFSPDEQQRLRAIIPGVFGDQAIGATVAATGSAPSPLPAGQPATPPGKKPWWAFWRS